MSFLPAAAGKSLACGAHFLPKAKSGHQKKNKYRSAEGETHRVMDDRVLRGMEKKPAVSYLVSIAPPGVSFYKEGFAGAAGPCKPRWRTFS